MQLIQTVTAVDADEPRGGQHFFYSLAPEAANNPNFTLRDNQGRAFDVSHIFILKSSSLKDLQKEGQEVELS